MKRTRLVLSAGGLLLAAQAAAAHTVEPPAGFGIRSTHELRSVIYSERTGTLPNTVDRAALEQICRAAVEAGSVKRMPEFGEGADKPLSTRTVQFMTPDAEQRASFTEINVYNCDKAELKRAGPCGCDYHRFVQHRVEISLWKSGQLQRWQATLEDGDGAHDISAQPSPRTIAAPKVETLDRLFGPVSGKRHVAGFRCEQREINTGTMLRQTCLSLPDPKLPELFWGRGLASQARDPSGGRPGFQIGHELQRLEVGVEVDTGVFQPPTGLALRDLRLPAFKDITP